MDSLGVFVKETFTGTMKTFILLITTGIVLILGYVLIYRPWFFENVKMIK